MSSDWLKTTIYNSKIVSFSPEFQAFFDEHFPSLQFTFLFPQYFFWILVWCCLFLLANWVLAFSEKKGWILQTNWEHRITCVFHVLNTLCSTQLFIVSIYSLCMYDSALYHVFKTGTLNQQDLGTYSSSTESFSVKVLEWSEPLSLPVKLKALTIWVGYGMIPLLICYCVELFTISVTTAIKGKSSGAALFFIHHLIAMLLNFMGLEPVFSCLNMKYLRICWITFLHISLEAPCFINMLIYRYSKNRRLAKGFMFFCIIYTLILRLFVAGFSFWSFIDTSWLTPIPTNWDILWRVVFPFLWVGILVAQLYIVYIYCLLYLTRFRGVSTFGKNQKKIEINEICCDGVIEMDTPISSINSDKHSKAKSKASDSNPIAKPFLVALTSFIFLIFIGVIYITVPFNCETRFHSPQKIGIIGGGVSGLVTALLLSRTSENYDITIYEKEVRLGGAAYSVDVGNGRMADVAFLAFYEYHNFEALVEDLGVSKDAIATLNGAIISTWIDPINSSNSVFYTMSDSPLNMKTTNERYQDERKVLVDWIEHASRYFSEEKLMTYTIGDFVRDNNFTEAFIQGYITPCISSYVGTEAGLFSTVVGVWINFEHRFKACSGYATAKNFKNSSNDYLVPLIRELQHNGVKFHLNTEVNSLSPDGASNVIRFNQTETETFDHVVVALRTEPLITLLENSPKDFEALAIPRNLYTRSNQEYRQIQVQVVPNASKYPPFLFYEDPSFDPVREAMSYTLNGINCSLFDCYNFIVGEGLDAIIFPYFNNKRCYEKDNFPPYLFYSDPLSPRTTLLPAPEIKKYVWNHTAHTTHFMKAGRNMHSTQGKHNVWFAGAEMIYNLHEPGVISGITIANALGAKYPFPDNALAKESFLGGQYWMMFGLNPFIPKLSKRQT